MLTTNIANVCSINARHEWLLCWELDEWENMKNWSIRVRVHWRTQMNCTINDSHPCGVCAHKVNALISHCKRSKTQHITCSSKHSSLAAAADGDNGGHTQQADSHMFICINWLIRTIQCERSQPKSDESINISKTDGKCERFHIRLGG